MTAARLSAVRPLIVLCLLALSACGSGGGFRSGPPTGQALADQQTRAACRQRAEEFDNQRNRAEIYSPPPSVNTPYSANYLPDQADRGLSQMYAHDQLVNDCIRNTGTGSERSQPPAEAPVQAPPRSHEPRPQR